MFSPAHKTRLTEEQNAAQRTGLTYVTDSLPGSRRIKTGHGFKDLTSHGHTIRSRKTLDRIRALVIPPAQSLQPLPSRS